MKSVLISIRPKWCELIASGEKTIEVRKTRPKLETPFKCYIYCTKNARDPDKLWVLNKRRRQEYGGLTAVCANLAERPDYHYDGNGKVIGEFVCDCIKTYPADDFVGAKDFNGSIITEPKDGEFAYWIPEESETRLSHNEIHTYGSGKTLYGWHISDFKIYDVPKELGDFWKADKCLYATESGCTYKYHCFRAGQTQRCGEELTRPPQSWCYMEEIQ